MTPPSTPKRFSTLERRYGLDLRSLALLRMGLALIILMDLFKRIGDLTAHYSDAGVLPRSLLTQEYLTGGYWSFHALSGSPIFQGLLFGVAALIAIAMLLGYKTRLATIASWALIISLHNRNPALIFAADDVLRAVMFWAMFLPLGARFSLDAAFNPRSLTLPQRVFSAATVALMVQQCGIYMFSALFKTSSTIWWPEGSAVYYSLSFDQYVTPLGRLFLNAPPVMTLFTHATLVLEWLGPLLIFMPFRTSFFRNLAVALFVSLHLGFGLTLNLGVFPWLSTFTWLAFIPSATWEGWTKRVFGPPQRGLTIYYDVDCGFCKKVVHLIRTFLVLPHKPLLTAQSDPSICADMEEKNSWVVVDWQGQRHFKFEAIAYVVSLSPVIWWLEPVLRWKPLMQRGTHFYEWIATNRRVAGRFTKPFKFKEYGVNTPLWANGVVGILLLLTLVWNFRSFTNHRNFIDSNNPAVNALRRVTNSRSLQRLNGISRVTRLDQSWSIFAPDPPVDDGWHVVVGTLEDGSQVDLMRNGAAVSFDKPTLGDRSRVYGNMQWRTLFINLNRGIGKQLQPPYVDYLCRQWNRSHGNGKQLTAVDIFFMDERTVPPGETQPVEQTTIYQSGCAAE
ncbi:MAG: DCC1-like thiol-disulfide oxidoreductase family protein [Cyanobacteria bacterium P01_A01_bin.123]